jgi:hypothetical protein
MHDLGHAAVPCLKGIGDQYKDMENKEKWTGTKVFMWLKQKGANEQRRGYKHNIANIHPLSGGAFFGD